MVRVTGSGYFRQNDMILLPPWQHRYLRVYALSADASTIVTSVEVLNYTHGTSWHHRTFTISGLTPGEMYRIGVGRGDDLPPDFHLTAEWAQLKVR